MEIRISLYTFPPYLIDSMQGSGEGGKLKTRTQCFFMVTSDDILEWEGEEEREEGEEREEEEEVEEEREEEEEG